MDAAAVAVRFALYAALTLGFGLPAFVLLSVRNAGRSLPLSSLLSASILLGFTASVVGLLVAAGSMAGTGLLGVDRETLGIVLLETPVGTAWIVRMGALVVASTTLLFLRGRQLGTAVAGGALGVALATLAWGGHGAMDEGMRGRLHLAADIAHLAAAGIWIGALVALSIIVFHRSDRVDAAHLDLAHRALRTFSGTGTAVVAVIVLTGVVNTWLILGIAGLSAAPTTLYGRLLLAKIVLFGAMFALASVNRFRLTPALERGIVAGDHRAAMGALRRSLAFETGCAMMILALVAWLGTLEPIPAAV